MFSDLDLLTSLSACVKSRGQELKFRACTCIPKMRPGKAWSGQKMLFLHIPSDIFSNHHQCDPFVML